MLGGCGTANVLRRRPLGSACAGLTLQRFSRRFRFDRWITVGLPFCWGFHVIGGWSIFVAQCMFDVAHCIVDALCSVVAVQPAFWHRRSLGSARLFKGAEGCAPVSIRPLDDNRYMTVAGRLQTRSLSFTHGIIGRLCWIAGVV